MLTMTRKEYNIFFEIQYLIILFFYLNFYDDKLIFKPCMKSEGLFEQILFDTRAFIYGESNHIIINTAFVFRYKVTYCWM